METKKNNYKEFVGLDKIKEKHSWQLAQFERWAANGEWINFHHAHYDWWMFPYDRPSSYGYGYSVFDDEVTELKKDKLFISNYLRGCELLMTSWGWDLANECLIKNPSKDQTWHQWAIRIFKCAKSLQQFGFEKEFCSVKKYALILIKEGNNFSFHGEDLSWLFLQ